MDTFCRSSKLCLRGSSIIAELLMPTLRCTALFILAILSGCGETAREGFPGYAEADYVRLASPIAGSLARVYLNKGDSVAANAAAFVLEQESERAARIEALAGVERARRSWSFRLIFRTA